LGNCGKSEDAVADNGISKDTRQEKGQDGNRTEDLELGTQYKPFQCPDCPTRFSRRGELNRHSQKHGPGRFLCTFPGCCKVYYRKDKLRQHWRKEHGETLQPANLSSSRQRRDPNQDGNSRSQGSSNGEDDVIGGPSSEQSSKSKDVSNSSPPNKGCASGGPNASSRSPDQPNELGLSLVRSGKADVSSAYGPGPKKNTDSIRT
jgi:hypothetical protein